MAPPQWEDPAEGMLERPTVAARLGCLLVLSACIAFWAILVALVLWAVHT